MAQKRKKSSPVFSVDIRGQKWKFQVITDKLYKKRHTKGGAIDYVALCSTDNKTISFRFDHISERVVRHELYHAFYSTLYTASADLEEDQIEEILAEFWEENYYTFGEKVQEVFSKIKKYQKN